MMLHSLPSWLQATQIHKMRVQKHRWWRPLLWAGLLALTLLMAWQVATLRALQAAETVALSDAWRFVDESKPGAPMVTGALAATADDAPAQVAARFELSSTMQALALQLDDAELAGVPLGQVEELSYCTRLVDGPRPYAVTLQVNVDADVTDDDNSWQGRLVYTPSYNGAVIQGEWQCWNTLVGKWWATGGPVAAHATVDNAQPLGTLLAHFPNLGIHTTYSVVALKAGDGWNAFRGEASPVVLVLEGERLDVAFGTPPAENVESNEVLLPVLVNEPQTPDAEVEQPQESEEPNSDEWDNVDWAKAEWGEIDWQNFDWEQVEWEKLDWGLLAWATFGMNDEEREAAIYAFVEDVKQCKDRGWETLGFKDASDCVAYYVQEHTPTDLNWDDLKWGDFEWSGSWDRRDGDNNNWRNGRNRWNNRRDDD